MPSVRGMASLYNKSMFLEEQKKLKEQLKSRFKILFSEYNYNPIDNIKSVVSDDFNGFTRFWAIKYENGVNGKTNSELVIDTNNISIPLELQERMYLEFEKVKRCV